MKRNLVVFLILIAVLVAATWYFTRPKGSGGMVIEVPVSFGRFVISVTTTGELEARSSEKIYGPSPTGLREARIWQLRIDDIIPDGTIVDSGAYVATLDRTELTNKFKDQELELEQLQNNFTRTQLDTTMTLRAARNDLVNLQFALEEAQITVDQSIYEPPATQRQAQIELDRAQRSYEQALRNYSLQYEKAVANMSEVSTSLRKAQNKFDELKDLASQFIIHAPKSGMVVYQRDWDGRRRGIGSSISTWENIVATLPNLTEMITKTFVNEIDISKVRVGQSAEIGVDAFPEKRFTGQVIEVANIGEQMRNSSAKVFEVKIEVNEYDSVLRPAMTTKNIIITEVIDSVYFVPLEAVHAVDTLTFVYSGSRRQQVIAGKANDNEIIIHEGLGPNDKVRLIPPETPESYRLSLLPEDVIQQYKIRQEQAIKAQNELNERQMNRQREGKRPPEGQAQIIRN
jgi:HlyD family secretion protein